MSSRLVTVLEKVLKIVQSGWCQRTLAIDKEGERVLYDSTLAHKFCINGAIQRATKDLDLQDQIRDAIKEVNGIDSALYVWNDKHGRTKAQVIRAIRNTIRAETSEKRLVQRSIRKVKNG